MTTITPYRSTVRESRDGFGQLLHAEWTKFRTVRGWVIGVIVAVLLTAGLGALLAKAASPQCAVQTSNGQQHAATCSRGRTPAPRARPHTTRARRGGGGGWGGRKLFRGGAPPPFGGNGTLTV